MLEFSGITKRFGAVTAVSDFSARVEPGRVTGFLGPNGAGKTTTLRILLGLVRASGGSATIGGSPYASLAHPLQTVGAVLEASSFHPGRTAANHLKVYAQAAGLPTSRVTETLGLVGLSDAAGRKVGGFSLGMRQRLGLAYALLGDPGVLVLDEPANGLDPEGIKWLRGFLRQLAREGRTVLVSSHLLAEVQQTVDSVLIIAQGRLVYQGALEGLADPSEYATVVDSPDRSALRSALESAGASVEVLRSGLTVRGLDPAAVGAIAASAGVALSGLQRRGPALEEVFLDLVSGARVHHPATDPGNEQVAGITAAAIGSDAVESDAVESDAVESDAVEAAERDADTADEASAVAAQLDAESGGAPGAAVAAGAASGAATGMAVWVGGDDDAPAADGTGEDAAADEPPVEPAVDPTPSPTFAVASTGVIDIVGFEAGDPQTDAYVDGRPLDADPDVEALGEIDDELSDIDPEDGGSGDADPADDADTEVRVANDRPWETYVKTDADVEADAFFASFSGTEQQPNDGSAEEATDTPDADAEEATDAPDADAEASDESTEHARTDGEEGEQR